MSVFFPNIFEQNSIKSLRKGNFQKTVQCLEKSIISLDIQWNPMKIFPMN